MPHLTLVDPVTAIPATDVSEGLDYADLVHTAFIAVWFAITIVVFAVHP